MAVSNLTRRRARSTPRPAPPTTTTTRTTHHGPTPIPYQLIIAQRKTLSITVHLDGTVIVKAPRALSARAITERVNARAPWIHKKITHFAQLPPPTPAPRYVPGETHRYLGRQYRLKILPLAPPRKRAYVTLHSAPTGGYLVIHTPDPTPERVQALLRTWYRRQALEHFTELFERTWADFRTNAQKPTLALRAMKRRWGSLTRSGRLTLNTDLIRAPRSCIEYVITHELCHLEHFNHSRAFYQLMDAVMPDWKERKHTLEAALA